MNLRELRFKKALTQYDLVLISGIHQSRISLIESGYTLPSEAEMQKLTRALGVDPGQLTFELKSFDGPIGAPSSADGQKLQEVNHV